MDKSQYIQEAKRQLEDTNYYTKLEKPIFIETAKLIYNIMGNLKQKGFISEKQRIYLIVKTQPCLRRFYMLPKIHKDPHTWPVPFTIPPGRPIVSDCGSETYPSAEYLDYYINPLSTTHPSYLKDTYDFITKLQATKCTENCFLFTMDVTNLYMNIPIEEGINCIRQIFNTHPDAKRPSEELIQLLNINLTRNDFEFNNEYYLQTKGTAMGKKFAPAYANIYMSAWEKGAMAKCKQTPLLYLRFLDDFFGIWTGTEVEFTDFFNILNQHNSSIQLTYTLSKNNINFLDKTVFKGTQFTHTYKLDTKVYFKPTDTALCNALLHKHSHHPKHTFKGIIKSQLLRFHRICTQHQDFVSATTTLFQTLKKRGYSKSLLKQCLQTYKQPRPPRTGNFIPLTTYFSTNNRLIHQHLKHSFQNTIGTSLLPNTTIISAFRKNKNLKDWLVTAKIPNTEIKKSKHTHHFSKQRFIKNHNTNTTFYIKQHITEFQNNVVYLLYCNLCNTQYIGETKYSINTTLQQHLGNIKYNRDDTKLVQHFQIHARQNIRIMTLEHNETWSDRDRKKQERLWIHLLDTKDPKGLNMKLLRVRVSF